MPPSQRAEAHAFSRRSGPLTKLREAPMATLQGGQYGESRRKYMKGEGSRSKTPTQVATIELLNPH